MHFTIKIYLYSLKVYGIVNVIPFSNVYYNIILSRYYLTFNSVLFVIYHYKHLFKTQQVLKYNQLSHTIRCYRTYHFLMLYLHIQYLRKILLMLVVKLYALNQDLINMYQLLMHHPCIQHKQKQIISPTTVCYILMN